MQLLPKRYAYLLDLKGEKRTTAYVILTLGFDAVRCEENLIQSFKEGTFNQRGYLEADYPFHARQLIRAIFAYIEAVTFSIKLSAASQCMRSGIEISPPERYFAIDVGYELTEKGTVAARDAHIRLAPNIRFAISLYERAFALSSEFDPSAEWWSCLRRTIKVRDRLTHPKLPRDVEVSGEELVEAQKAKAGFESLMYRYLQLAGQLPEELLKRQKASKGRKEPKDSRTRGKPWTKTDVTQLQKLAKRKAPISLIALKLGRTETAVRRKAATVGISLKHTAKR